MLKNLGFHDQLNCLIRRWWQVCVQLASSAVSVTLFAFAAERRPCSYQSCPPGARQQTLSTAAECCGHMMGQMERRTPTDAYSLLRVLREQSQNSRESVATDCIIYQSERNNTEWGNRRHQTPPLLRCCPLLGQFRGIRHGDKSMLLPTESLRSRLFLAIMHKHDVIHKTGNT